MLAGARDPIFGRRAWRVRMTRGVYFLIRRGGLSPRRRWGSFRRIFQSLWSNAVGLLCGIVAAQPGDREAMVEERLRAGHDRLT